MVAPDRHRPPQVLVEPARRSPFKYPTPEANRKVMRDIKGSFLKMSTAASPMGELTFGIVDIAGPPSATETKEEKAEPRSPMPPKGRTNTHVKFNADGSAELVNADGSTEETATRRSSWIASAPTASFKSDPSIEPVLTLWHEMVTPERSTEWTAEEWAEWEADEWNAWEEAQAGEWAAWEEEEWAAWEEEEWAAWEEEDGAGEVVSPIAMAPISTPDSSRVIKILGKVGRMQRVRGPTPEAHKAEGRTAALETLELIQKARTDAASAMAELSVSTPNRFKLHLAKTPSSAKRSNKKATPIVPVPKALTPANLRALEKSQRD